VGIRSPAKCSFPPSLASTRGPKFRRSKKRGGSSQCTQLSAWRPADGSESSRGAWPRAIISRATERLAGRPLPKSFFVNERPLHPLVRLNVCELDYLGPLLYVIRDTLAEVGGRAR